MWRMAPGIVKRTKEAHQKDIHCLYFNRLGILKMRFTLNLIALIIFRCSSRKKYLWRNEIKSAAFLIDNCLVFIMYVH